MENIPCLSTYLEKYSIFYLSKYTITQKKFERILHRKIYKDFASKKISFDQKESSGDIINKLVEKFVDIKVINEKVMIKNRLNSLIKKGSSLKKIYYVLKKDQFPENIINAEMDELKKYEGIEKDLLRNYCRKKNIVSHKKDDNKSYNKTLNKLILEGFRKETCIDFFENT